MSEEHAVPESPELEALHKRLAENSLGGHWQSREKPPKLKPWVWPWSAIYSCLMESGEVVKLGGIDDAAKRRTVQLVNPAITNLKATSRTIQMSIQLVKPGERETARATPMSKGKKCSWNPAIWCSLRIGLGMTILIQGKIISSGWMCWIPI